MSRAPSRARIGGVVLAAGASRRAGEIKALVEYGGATFIERAVATLREGGCDEVRVVVGPPHADAIMGALSGVEWVHNEAPERGMLSSLRLALRDEWRAAVVALVDHPRVSADTVSRLLARWSEGDADVVRARFDGRTGHPYVVSRALFAALREASLDAGARPVYASARRVEVEVDDPGVLDDFDTAVAIAKLRAP